MPLIRNGAVIADPWIAATDTEPLPPAAPVLIAFARWHGEKAGLLARTAPLGLALRNSDPVEAIGCDAGRFALIALEFPKFTDGRAYSQARLLRERYGFAGELRATGQILPDQLVHMLRAGFDTFLTADARLLANWARAVAAYPAFYQRIGGLRPTLDDLRRCEGEAGSPPARTGAPAGAAA